MKTPIEILETALENEMKSRDYYARLAQSCSVDFINELLLRLQNEESRHVYMIQNMLERLRGG